MIMLKGMYKMNEKLHKYQITDKSLSNPKIRYVLLFIMFIVAFAIRCVNFDNSLTQEMHSFRQAQTAITVQCYINDGWSLFKYETPVFGAPWNVIFECPIYQSIVYAFMKSIGTVNVDMGCRIISIVMFMLSAVMLYRFSLLLTNETGLSMIIYSLYLFLPYNIYWSRAALIDYTSVLFGLIYACNLIDWLYNRKRLSYEISMIFGICAYLQKSTSMFPVIAFTGMFILKYYYDSYKQSGRNIKSYISEILTMRLTFLIMLCIIPAVVVLR